MGNFVAVEALRQMAIRNRGLSPKIKDIMLASPDIDFDVFRRQIAEIEASDKAPPVTLFVSKDDKALAHRACSPATSRGSARSIRTPSPTVDSREGAGERDRPDRDQVRRPD